MRFKIMRRLETGFKGDSFGRVNNFQCRHVRDGGDLANRLTVHHGIGYRQSKPGLCAFRFGGKGPPP